MKPLLRWTFAIGLFFLMNFAARAQDQSPCTPTRQAFGFLQVRSTAGCPFSAIVEVLKTQTLADGTHIQTRAKVLVYRDSYGRVSYYSYQPVGLDEPYPDSPNLIQIEDSVAGFIYFLAPQRSHVAMRSSLAPPTTSATRSADPTPSAPKPEVSFENLGTQNILGFPVTGERAIRTFPVGMDHNDRPITVVSETWRSLDLGLIFLQRGSDPRSVDEEIRVTSFEQFEPNAALFQLPSGYTFQDQKPR